MPLSTIFQLYRGGQFCWWRKPEYPGESHWPVASHSQTYHIMLYWSIFEIFSYQTRHFLM